MIFEGSELHVNFSTSAWGAIKIRLKDLNGKTIESYPMFGDSIDKRIVFHGDIGRFSGKPVIMECEIRDGDVYSFRFC